MIVLYIYIYIFICTRIHISIYIYIHIHIREVRHDRSPPRRHASVGAHTRGPRVCEPPANSFLFSYLNNINHFSCFKPPAGVSVGLYTAFTRSVRAPLLHTAHALGRIRRWVDTPRLYIAHVFGCICQWVYKLGL